MNVFRILIRVKDTKQARIQVFEWEGALGRHLRTGRAPPTRVGRGVSSEPHKTALSIVTTQGKTLDLRDFSDGNSNVLFFFFQLLTVGAIGPYKVDLGGGPQQPLGGRGEA